MTLKSEPSSALFGGDDIQYVICDGCGMRLLWSRWYTVGGVYPTGWIVMYRFDGKSYHGKGHLCGQCCPADIPMRLRQGASLYRHLWLQYQERRLPVDNIVRPANPM